MGRHRTNMTYKKQKRRRRIFWFLIFPILLIASVTVTYGVHLYKKAENAMGAAYDDEQGQSSLRDKKVNPKIDNVSILLIGVDGGEKRGVENTRSDALMVATFNEKQKSVKLMTIPRDAYVYIPEVEYSTKINHAHAFGGPRATIETVENLLDIPIDYYVSLNFEAFMSVIDALDGIDIEVPFAFSEQDSNDKANAISLEEGWQTLNGEEALALARTRKMDSDFMRGQRQQEIMKAIAKKAASATSVLKYGSVIDAIGENMRTNMTFDEMKAFVDYGISGNLDIESFSLKGEDMYQMNSLGQNIYYYGLDEVNLEEVKNELKQHLEVASDVPTSEDENDLNETNHQAATVEENNY